MAYLSRVNTTAVASLELGGISEIRASKDNK